ncbi:MAG: tRNA pseudouridine(13) synthase TruD [Candidatus Woesearchaeota archaeon]
MFKIKQVPEDFRVREILQLNSSKEGKYCYFLMKKKQWTTMMAIHKIAEKLHINPRAFSVAGMKDKAAITEQHVACYGQRWERLRNPKIKDISLQFIGYGNEAIRVGGARANEFLITVRNLEKPLTPIKNMCNYYDDQRFGGIRPNAAEVGKQLLLRNFEQAMKTYLTSPFPTETKEHKDFRTKILESWGSFHPSQVPGYLPNEKAALTHLQKHPKDFIGAFKAIPKRISTLFIHAYQSLMFNRLLNNYVKENFNCFDIDYCFGKLCATDEEIKQKLPLIGYDYEVKSEGINFNFKEIPYLTSRTVMRNASVKIGSLRMKEAEKDELNSNKLKQKVSFSLESGSYATMAIKHMAAKDINSLSS